jgi:uncharacterized membrane protein YgcG
MKYRFMLTLLIAAVVATATFIFAGVTAGLLVTAVSLLVVTLVASFGESNTEATVATPPTFTETVATTTTASTKKTTRRTRQPRHVSHGGRLFFVQNDFDLIELLLLMELIADEAEYWTLSDEQIGELVATNETLQTSFPEVDVQAQAATAFAEDVVELPIPAETPVVEAAAVETVEPTTPSEPTIDTSDTTRTPSYDSSYSSGGYDSGGSSGGYDSGSDSGGSSCGSSCGGGDD